MLVLSRKKEEAVVIGGADGFQRLLKVTVLQIKGRNVRLGFEVDTGVPVHRAEQDECTPFEIGGSQAHNKDGNPQYHDGSAILRYRPAQETERRVDTPRLSYCGRPLRDNLPGGVVLES